MAKAEFECGAKHMKIYTAIAAVMIPALVTVVLWVNSAMAATDIRLRGVEQQNARIEERLVSIQQSLARIEKTKTERGEK